MSRFLTFLAAVLWAVATATAGWAVTGLGPWYQGLKKPWWQPPDIAFGPAWTIIFALAAIALYIAWRAKGPERSGTALAVTYIVNGLLNFGWSLLFFGLHRPDWAMVEWVALWLSVVAMIVVAAPYSHKSVWLLVPYLLWVSFAGYLNYVVIQLNGPFG